MSGPQFFQTRMGQKFYEHTMPTIADALEKIAKNSEPDEGIDTSQLKDPYVRLDIPDSDLYVQVKLDDEGVAVDLFDKNAGDNSDAITGTWKLYQEMHEGE